MLANLIDVLSPPALKDVRDGRAAILNAILVAAIISLSLFYLGSRIMGVQLVPTTDALILALIVVMLGLLVLVRRGQAHVAGIALISFGWLAMSYQAWITGGLRGSAFVANVLVILGASLLGGSRTATIFAALGIASTWLFAAAEQTGDLAAYTAPPFLAATEMTIILALAALLVHLLVRNLAKALTSARLSNRQLQDLSNNLEHQVLERTKSTEAARAEAEAARKAMESRVRLTTMQARLSDCMRGAQDVSTLAGNVISQLCKDLSAPVGRLYLVEGNALTLKGSFAYRITPASGGETFALGEGVIGQAVLEKRAVILTDVPPTYFAIKSGLGQITPRTISVQPFSYDGQVVGVVELATLSTFGALDLEYLQAATENIGIAFNTARARDQIDRLLLETQAQADALLAQEEKLRSANQELEHQTRTLKESGKQLLRQQQELEAANLELKRSAAVLREQQATLDAQNKALRTTRAELEIRATELERASKYKSEFLANMSHELRTPLNSLLILARILADNEEGNLTPDQVKSARIVYSSGHDLLSLINDILDLSKIEAGKMEFLFAPMALPELVQGMEQQFTHVAADKGLIFETEIAADLPPVIQSDQRRIEQVLRNLLSNAFKFTDTGYVRLAVSQSTPEEALLVEYNAGNKVVAIRVADSGIGMTPAQQAIVFKGFQQADGGTSRKYGGTGLGLTISRELVTRLGGHTTLTSEPGNGSTFTVLLPVWPDQTELGHGRKSMQPAPSDRPIAIDRQRQQPRRGQSLSTLAHSDDRYHLDSSRRLLIVDDDAQFARIVFDQAHEADFQCLIANNGETALSLARAHQPRGILLDLNLPDISGWEVLRQLKIDVTTQDIPVYIISVEDEQTAAYRMGAIGFLSKPVSRDDLEGVLDAVEKHSTHHVPRLLIVEDDPVARRALKRRLEESDMVVSDVEDGGSALARLQKESFDCVILDLYLPDMDGFDLLKHIVAPDSGRKCSVVVHTGKDLAADESAALLAFVDNMFIKGDNSIEKVVEEVQRLLARARMPKQGTGPLPLPFLDGAAASTMNDVQSTQTGRLSPKPKTVVFPPESHILVVDDDVRSAFALSKLLGDHSLRVTIASGGGRALEILAKDPTLSLVLMDIMMPEMDGFETIRRIRNEPQFSNLPIIAVTALAMTGDAEKCLAAGADDYLAKPVSVDKLIVKLQTWLNDEASPAPRLANNGVDHDEAEAISS